MKNITSAPEMTNAVLGIPTSLTISILTKHRERKTRTLQAVAARTVLRIDSTAKAADFLDDDGFWVPSWVERYLAEYEKENNRKVIDYSLDNYCYYPWLDLYDNELNLDLIKKIPVNFIIAEDSNYEGSALDLLTDESAFNPLDVENIQVIIGDSVPVDLPDYFFDEVLETKEVDDYEDDMPDTIEYTHGNDFPRLRNWAYGAGAKTVTVVLNTKK